MKKRKKLGYMFYPSVWKELADEMDLNLEQRAIFRELLDKAYQKDNEIVINLRAWTVFWNTDTNTIKKELIELQEKGMIEVDGEIVSVNYYSELIND